MRADAEIDEGVGVLALFSLDCVAGDLGLTGGLLFDQLHFERLTVRGEELQRFVARPHPALVAEVLRRQLLHPLFNRVEVLRYERTIDDEIVEEAFIGGRTDTALGAGEQLRHRCGEKMRGAVAEECEGFRTAVGDDRHLRVLLERVGEIDQTSVDGRRERGLRQPWRHLRRNVADSAARAHATAGPVG